MNFGKLRGRAERRAAAAWRRIFLQAARAGVDPGDRWAFARWHAGRFERVVAFKHVVAGMDTRYTFRRPDETPGLRNELG